MVQVSVAPNSGPPWPIQREFTILYSDPVVLSYSFCACCDEILHNSKSLNDPSQWITKSSRRGRNEPISEDNSLGIGKQQSTNVIEYLEYDA